jgi:hypothetical protein
MEMESEEQDENLRQHRKLLGLRQEHGLRHRKGSGKAIMFRTLWQIYSPLKDEVVETADDAEKHNACHNEFHLKDERLLVVDVNSFAQPEQLLIDFIQLADEGRKLSRFDECKQKASRRCNKANYHVHRMS